jgi:deoxyribose-phosphate aldolase
MPYSYPDLAGMIDHALLHPTLTDAEVRAGCDLACSYAVASACVRPCDVPLAAECLAGSAVAVGTVIGFPHGSNATEIKRLETAQACRDGATEIDVVINIGKALSGDWAYVENELRTITEETHAHRALLKVIFETDFLTDDLAKIRLCEICDHVGVDFVKTSTGFGFVRQPDGRFLSAGATAHDIALMRAHTSPRMRIKASGGIRNLDQLIAMRELGASRCGTSATANILNEFRQRESVGKSSAAPAHSVPESGVSSY